MVQVKIPVLQADGKYRGSLFKDGTWHDNRWIGAPKPGLQETMVCTGPIETGAWLLIEYVLPRQITGEEERDSLFDQASRCCVRTLPQALHWFTLQTFGPPPALVERVRTFAADWQRFRASTSAQSLLGRLLDGFVDRDHQMFSGQASSDLALLKSLELVCEASGSTIGYMADSIVKDMGVRRYIAWTDDHLSRVAALVFRAGSDLPEAARDSATTCRSPVTELTQQAPQAPLTPSPSAATMFHCPDATTFQVPSVPARSGYS
jgi:hypothetical protein